MAWLLPDFYLTSSWPLEGGIDRLDRIAKSGQHEKIKETYKKLF
jgi:hypothetical protein